MKKEKMSNKKQIIILSLVLVLLIIFIVFSHLYLNNKNNTSTDTTSNLTSSDTTSSLNNTTLSSTEETIETRTVNGKTKSEWKKIRAYIDETAYEIIMETFEDDDNFIESNNITIDIDEAVEKVTSEDTLEFENYIMNGIENLES